MRGEGIQVMGRGNYVLSMYHYSFTNACLRYARHGTDHWMVMAVLRCDGAHYNRCYMRVRTLWPITLKGLAAVGRRGGFQSTQGGY